MKDENENMNTVYLNGIATLQQISKNPFFKMIQKYVNFLNPPFRNFSSNITMLTLLGIDHKEVQLPDPLNQ